MSNTPPVNLLNFHYPAMQDFFVELGEKPFRAQQALKWIHQFGITDFEKMSNFSKSLRDKLQQSATITPPDIALEQASADGTIKWLLRLADNNCIETVFIPEGKRGTLCVSSQVGCALNCSFCSTGKQGFSRNLTVAEIIGQVWLATRRLSTQEQKHDRHITNVVMMGMGEPLHNFDNVVAAINLMMDDFAYGLSKYRVTLSTSGLIPAMEQLSKISDVSLAVSLHAPNNELRDQLVPINKKYPVEQLMQACKNYFQPNSKRLVTFEYVMLENINDQPLHAKQLAKLLKTVPGKVNLIPFNPFPATQYKRSSAETIQRFRDILLASGINTITRKTRGDDIDAACGQLVGMVKRKKRYNEVETA